MHFISFTARTRHQKTFPTCDLSLLFYLSLMAFNIVDPSWAGERVTYTPAASSAANFSSAPPLPPAMIAPAWPNESNAISV